MACHGPDDGKRQAHWRLVGRETATGKLDSGAVAIVPGKSVESELICRVTSTEESERIPPVEYGKPLSPEEKALLQRWIVQGARYDTHWSYVKLVTVEPPAAPEVWRSWAHSPVDFFAMRDMLAHHLHPAPEADRHTLAHRVFFDLIGLPPTVEEVDAFVASADPQA